MNFFAVTQTTIITTAELQTTTVRRCYVLYGMHAEHRQQGCRYSALYRGIQAVAQCILGHRNNDVRVPDILSATVTIGEALNALILCR